MGSHLQTRVTWYRWSCEVGHLWYGWFRDVARILFISRYMMASTPHDWRYPDPPAAANMKPLVKAVT